MFKRINILMLSLIIGSSSFFIQADKTLPSFSRTTYEGRKHTARWYTRALLALPAAVGAAAGIYYIRQNEASPQVTYSLLGLLGAYGALAWRFNRPIHTCIKAQLEPSLIVPQFEKLEREWKSNKSEFETKYRSINRKLNELIQNAQRVKGMDVLVTQKQFTDSMLANLPQLTMKIEAYLQDRFENRTWTEFLQGHWDPTSYVNELSADLTYQRNFVNIVTAALSGLETAVPLEINNLQAKARLSVANNGEERDKINSKIYRARGRIANLQEIQLKISPLDEEIEIFNEKIQYFESAFKKYLKDRNIVLANDKEKSSSTAETAVEIIGIAHKLYNAIKHRNPNNPSSPVN